MNAEDRAQEQELLMWQRNNTVRSHPTYTPDDPGYGPAECDDCEEPLPELRRIDGRRRCTACQSRIERQQR